MRPDWELWLISAKEGTLVAEATKAGVHTIVLRYPASFAILGDAGFRGSAGLGTSKIAFLVKAVRSLPALWRYWRILKSTLQELNPDLVHSNGFKMHVLGAWAKPNRTPLIWHIHDYVSRRPLMRRILKLCRSKHAAIICNSRSVAADVQRIGLGQRPVHPIWNAVDLDSFSPHGQIVDLDALCQLSPPPPGILRLGLIATFARWKGHEVFLQALARLPDSIQIRAYVIGANIYETNGSQFTIQELQKLVVSLGLTDRVAFTGFLPDTASAMRALDLVVHASTDPEPFGLVIAEAMACGVPVVVSQAGGATEVAAGVDGVFFHQPGCAEDLSRAIILAIQSLDAGRQPNLKLRRRAEALFSLERFGREVSHLYAAYDATA
jgi:glycosyltransferase involved in cell wall biosynthesis